MIKTKKLDCGTTIVMEHIPYVQSAALGIWVRAGSVDETEDLAGVSHYIEHMMFKGTENRTARDIAYDVEKIGGQFNAFTGKDLTCYYSKCTTDHTADCFELLSDLFLNSVFPEEEMVREKGVVCEEISMNEDTPEDLCLDLLANAYYGNENYGRNILGSASNVKSFTEDDILAYKKARYCPENTVISFAGGVDPVTAQALVETYFGTLEKGAFESRTSIFGAKKESLVKTKPIEQMHIAIGYPALPRGDELEDAVNAVNGVLGGTMSARLFQEVREKRGLAYSVYSYVSSYAECGTQVIYAGVNPAQAQEAYDAVCNVVKDIKRNGVTEDEFLRSREQMKSGMFFSNESSNAQMLLYGKYMLYFDKIFDFEAKLDKINALTYAQSFAAIEKMFHE